MKTTNYGFIVEKTNKKSVKVQPLAKKATNENKLGMSKGVAPKSVPLKGNLTSKGKGISLGASVNGKGTPMVGAKRMQSKLVIAAKAKMMKGNIPVKGKKSVSLTFGKK